MTVREQKCFGFMEPQGNMAESVFAEVVPLAS